MYRTLLGGDSNMVAKATQKTQSSPFYDLHDKRGPGQEVTDFDQLLLGTCLKKVARKKRKVSLVWRSACRYA